MKKGMSRIIMFALSILFVSAGMAAGGGNATNGERLWKSRKCNNCHKLTEKKKVGPGVKGVTKRRSEGWLIKWLKNPQLTWEENDAETRKLRKWKKGLEKAKKTKMRIKKKLTDQEVSDLIAFMKKNDGG